MRATLAPVLVALALVGCEPPAAPELPDVAPKTVHVDHIRVQYATDFAPGSSDLTAAEATRLETFLDQAGLHPNEKLYIATREGDPLAARRVGRIVSVLAQRGLGAETVPPPPSGVAADHVVLLVDRYIVTPPACPDWSKSPGGDHDNSPGSDFGCATSTDLGLMVDDPRDLVMGRQLGPADAAPGLYAIERYRSDRLKPFLTGTPTPSAAAAGGAPASGGSMAPSGGGTTGAGGTGGGTTGQ